MRGRATLVTWMLIGLALAVPNPVDAGCCVVDILLDDGKKDSLSTHCYDGPSVTEESCAELKTVNPQVDSAAFSAGKICNPDNDGCVPPSGPFIHVVTQVANDASDCATFGGSPIVHAPVGSNRTLCNIMCNFTGGDLNFQCVNSTEIGSIAHNKALTVPNNNCVFFAEDIPVEKPNGDKNTTHWKASASTLPDHSEGTGGGAGPAPIFEDTAESVIFGTAATSTPALGWPAMVIVAVLLLVSEVFWLRRRRVR